jgi:hypothetical protein
MRQMNSPFVDLGTRSATCSVDQAVGIGIDAVAFTAVNAALPSLSSSGG